MVMELRPRRQKAAVPEKETTKRVAKRIPAPAKAHQENILPALESEGTVGNGFSDTAGRRPGGGVSNFGRMGIDGRAARRRSISPGRAFRVRDFNEAVRSFRRKMSDQFSCNTVDRISSAIRAACDSEKRRPPETVPVDFGTQTTPRSSTAGHLPRAGWINHHEASSKRVEAGLHQIRLLRKPIAKLPPAVTETPRVQKLDIWTILLLMVVSVCLVLVLRACSDAVFQDEKHRFLPSSS